MAQNIVCPNCGTEINLDLIAEKKYQAMLRKKEEELKAEMNKQALKWAEERAKKMLEEKTKQDNLKLKELEEQLKQEEKQKEELIKQELELRKKTRELEQKDKQRELELERKLDEERKKIEEKMQKELEEKQAKTFEEKIQNIQEEFRKKELEYQKQQEQLKKSLDDAKRKAEQASQQIQGDIQEDDIRDALKQAFPIDEIEDVPTWVKWADLIQTVKNSIGQKTWIIVWESKNTKSWQDSWLMKLKDDKLKVKWNIAILVTNVLPKNIENFWMIDDVMVCLPKYVIPVASMLRDKLISISKVEKSLEGKDIKMEMLYKYLASEEFSSKIAMMVDVFSNLKAWIDAERRAMEKNWKKREKDLERATFAITWMYWELESLMGHSLVWSEKLELPIWEDS